MIKSLAVIAVSAGVGVVVGDMVAEGLLKNKFLADKSDQVKKGVRFGAQGASIVLVYSLARSFAR